MNYYYVVIDKLNKTLELKECNTCEAKVMDEVQKEYNLRSRWEVMKRFSFFFNDTENKINFETIYKYARKYKVIA